MQVAPLVAAYYFWMFPLIRSALINITVDDTLPNPDTGERVNYTSLWTVGRTCAGCAKRPNTARAYLGSWHEATNVSDFKSVATASFDFNGMPKSSAMTAFDAEILTSGSALYVYGILYNDFGFILNDLKFYVDGHQYGSYNPDKTIDDGPTFKYNILLFSVDSLSLSPHMFRLDNLLGPDGSVVFLDYIVYTTDDSHLSNSSSPLPSSTIQPDASHPVEIPTPKASTPIEPNAFKRDTSLAAFAVSISVGSLVVIYFAWQAYKFFQRRKAIVQGLRRRSTGCTIITPSSLRTPSRITRHNSPSTDGDVTLVSNVCAIRVDTDVESLGSRGALAHLARRTEKWRTFIYGETRSSL